MTAARDGRARRPERLAPLALLGLLALAAGCGGVPTEASESQPPTLVGGSVVVERDAGLVGLWTRRALVTDGGDRLVSVETTWDFTSDGTVRRRVITDDLVSGFLEELVATGSWSTSATTATAGGLVTITFTAPTSTVLRLQYQLGFDATGTLLLDGLFYSRLVR